MRTAAVIAAAGRSENSLGFIPMLCLNRCTVIRSIVDTLYAAGVDHICVVTGYKAEIIENELEGTNVSIVRNSRYEETGMMDSVKMGIKSLDMSFDRIIITPGDIPLIHKDTIKKMIYADAEAVRPLYGDEYGHPLVVNREIAREILAHSGSDGLDVFLDGVCLVTDLAVDDRGVIMELDTKSDLMELKAKELSDLGDGKLRYDIQVSIARAGTVLSPLNVMFLKMIDTTGSIQTACSCLNISYTKGWKLLNEAEENLGYSLIERRPGGTGGGGSSLTNECVTLLEAYSGFTRKLNSYAEDIFCEFFTGQKKGRK